MHDQNRKLTHSDMLRELADIEFQVGNVARLCSPRGNAILSKQIQRIKDVRLNLKALPAPDQGAKP